MQSIERKYDFTNNGSQSCDRLPPPGFASAASAASSSSSAAGLAAASGKTVNKQRKQELIYQSAMNVGMAPGKQLLMTCFMLYMSGKALQIFSIMALGMAFSQPISRLAGISTAFSKYADSGVNITLPKLTFIVCNLAGLAIALFKANMMGLVPSATDWALAALPVRVPLQVSGGGLW